MPTPTNSPLVQANKLCILCKVCKVRQVPPGNLRRHNYACYCCDNKRRQARRAERWAAGERPRCKNHPDRTVSRTAWVTIRRRLCGNCNESRPSKVRHKKKYLQKSEVKEHKVWKRRSLRRARRIQQNAL